MDLSLFDVLNQAAKLLANLIIMGSGILGRAVVQAYRKALESKSFIIPNLRSTFKNLSCSMLQSSSQESFFFSMHKWCK